MAKKVNKFQTEDGQVFDTLAEAEAQDAKMGLEKELREEVSKLLIKLQNVEAYERYSSFDEDETLDFNRSLKTVLEILMNDSEDQTMGLLNLDYYYNSNC